MRNSLDYRRKNTLIMARLAPVGFLAPLLDGFYFAGVLAGVQQAAYQSGRHVIAIPGTPEDLCRSRLAFDQVCGWVVMLNVNGVAELTRFGWPVVAVSTSPPDFSCPAVLPDNCGGAYAATSHLIDLGHTRIAFTGYLANVDIGQRYGGYRQALSDRGITFNPELVFDIADNLESGGSDAARRMTACSLPCTALVAGTDLNAIGVIEGLRSRGVRVPEDVAITGFDDINAAQHTSPPLTTVRQRFDALGRQAAALVLDQLEGREAPAPITYVATELIVRRSSGVRLDTGPLALAADAEETHSDWRELLERRLVRLITSQPLAATMSARTVWPGAAILTQAIDAALHGEPLPAQAALEQAWREAVTHTLDLQILQKLVKLLAQVGGDQATHVADAAGALTRLDQLLDELWQLMMRARIDLEMRQIQHMQQRAETNYEFAMLGSAQDGAPSSRTLFWLNKTSVRSGCLGLWSRNDQSNQRQLVIVGIYPAGDGPLHEARLPTTAFPPLDVLALPEQPEEDEIIALFPVTSASQEWGVLALCGKNSSPLRSGLEHMRMWATLLGNALERERLLDTLQLAYERERALSDTVRELGRPVIPLLEGVVFLPLIGAIDSTRAAQIVETLLHEVSRHRARLALIDVTGVALIDTQVANALIRAAQALRLLGAQVMLTGIRPEVAQTLVSLGLDLRGILTQRDLQSGIDYALARRV
jgi:DNA-binding LacI/PurR family transcriptional regulator/anti-anti-sigma regulatory factor